MIKFTEIIALLTQIEEEPSVPKNLKLKIKSISIILNESSDSLKIDKSLQLLEEISEDPNTPSFIRAQIWNIASLLESK